MDNSTEKIFINIIHRNFNKQQKILFLAGLKQRIDDKMVESENDEIIKSILTLYYYFSCIPIFFLSGKKIIRPNESLCLKYLMTDYKLMPIESDISLPIKSTLNIPFFTIVREKFKVYVIPITNDGRFTGALILSKRRISDSEMESFMIINEIQNVLSHDNLSKSDICYQNITSLKEIDINSVILLSDIHVRICSLFSANALEKMKNLHLTHQILSHMQSILASAESLQITLYENESSSYPEIERLILQVTYLGVIIENLRSNLLDITYEDKNLQFIPIDKIINKIVSTLKPEANNKNISFLIEMTPTDLRVEKELMYRAFFNLIHNAIKYSYPRADHDSRKIVINGYLNNNTYTINIINWGIGILECEKDNLFKIGYRGILSSDRERTGSGIGLSEAKKVIEKHGGTIKIESVLIDGDELNGVYKTTVSINLHRSENVRI